MRGLQRLARVGCWLAILLAYVAALLPQREAPHLGGSDKLDHMAAFLVISFLARLAYRAVPVWVLWLLVVAFGGFIEASQALPFIGRDAEWGDWIADSVAAALGLGFAWPVLAWWRSAGVRAK